MSLFPCVAFMSPGPGTSKPINALHGHICCQVVLEEVEKNLVAQRAELRKALNSFGNFVQQCLLWEAIKDNRKKTKAAQRRKKRLVQVRYRIHACASSIVLFVSTAS